MIEATCTIRMIRIEAEGDAETLAAAMAAFVEGLSNTVQSTLNAASQGPRSAQPGVKDDDDDREA